MTTSDDVSDTARKLGAPNRAATAELQHGTLLRSPFWLMRLAALLACVLIARFATAAETERAWDLEMGIGTTSAPDYTGASASSLQLRVWIDGSYRTAALGTFAIDSGSLTIDPELRWEPIGSAVAGVGVLVGYRPGRSDRRPGFASLSGGDAALRGLPQIAAAIDAGVEGHLSAFGLPVFTQARSALNGSQGTLVTLGAYAPLPMGRGDELTLLPTVTWVDARQMRAFYGVAAAQSAASGVPEYRPGSGWENVALEIVGDWRLVNGWHLVASLAYERVIGNAMHSPLVVSKNQFSGLVGFALHL